MTQLFSELPEWLDPELWAEFLKQRKLLKKPMTEYAQKLMLKRLDQFRLQGQNPIAILQESLIRGWTGVFKLKPDQQRDVVDEMYDQGYRLTLGQRQGEA